jgi:F-type H+-transporting ATPase subunit a
MANPILHIKDSYYFEVPRAFWRYTEMDQVPEFLQKANHGATIEEYAHALDGKIIIPQPFGELNNLYEAASGFCISKFMIVELVVAAIIAVVFICVARKIQTGDAPRGKVWNLLETFLLFIRDEVARPAIGKKDADRFIPLLWTMFFFILGLNLAGMVPWVGAPTGAWAVTFAMACVTLLVGMVSGHIKFGAIGYWKNQVPGMKLPLVLAVILIPFIFLIEVGSLFIKHGVLSVRLLANMVAGHIVLLGIMTIAISPEGAMSNIWGVTATASILGATLFSCLELFVAFLQAYIFVFLSSLFIGASIHHH